MNGNTNTAATIDDAELDTAWDREDDDFDAADEAQTAEADQPKAEQQPADQPTATETNTDPAKQEGEQQPADQPELFDIVYRGQKEQLTREQAIPLIQKGRDYDTVRTERDQLKAEAEANAGAIELVKAYAQRMGMEVPQYLDWVRKQDLMRSGMDEKSADQTIQMEKRQAELDAQEARINAQKTQQDAVLQQNQAMQEARRKDLQDFLKVYPTCDPKTIPKEVWEKVSQGVGLTAAYTMHENQRLQAELEAERQNKVNRQRTPGGLSGNSGAELDEIDRYWNNDD